MIVGYGDLDLGIPRGAISNWLDCLHSFGVDVESVKKSVEGGLVANAATMRCDGVVRQGVFFGKCREA